MLTRSTNCQEFAVGGFPFQWIWTLGLGVDLDGRRALVETTVTKLPKLELLLLPAYKK